MHFKKLADYDLNINDDTREANIGRAIILVSKIPTIVAAWNRIRNGQHVIEPKEEESAWTNFLYMLRYRADTGRI